MTPAEKQARHRAKQQNEAARLRGLLYQLERAVWEASDKSFKTLLSKMPADC
jgi:hypothetical protein